MCYRKNMLTLFRQGLQYEIRIREFLFSIRGTIANGATNREAYQRAGNLILEDPCPQRLRLLIESDGH
jgi:hypothetical protein